MSVAVSMRMAGMIMVIAGAAMVVMILRALMIMRVVMIVVMIMVALNARILSVTHPPDVPSVARSCADAAKLEKTLPPRALPPAMLLLRPARSQGPVRTRRR